MVRQSVHHRARAANYTMLVAYCTKQALFSPLMLTVIGTACAPLSFRERVIPALGQGRGQKAQLGSRED